MEADKETVFGIFTSRCAQAPLDTVSLTYSCTRAHTADLIITDTQGSTELNQQSKRLKLSGDLKLHPRGRRFTLSPAGFLHVSVIEMGNRKLSRHLKMN